MTNSDLPLFGLFMCISNIFLILSVIYFIYPTYPSGGQLGIGDASEITVGDTSETLASQTISVSVRLILLYSLFFSYLFLFFFFFFFLLYSLFILFLILIKKVLTLHTFLAFVAITVSLFSI